MAAFGTEDGEERRVVLWVATGVAALLFGLAVAAFLTVGVTVVAYAGPVGWVAVVFTVLFGLLGYGVMIWQSPLVWPSWVGFRREERDPFEKHLRRSETGRQRVGGGDGLTRLPTRMPSRQQAPVKNDRGREYGRSTSGDYAGATRQYSRRGGRDEMNRSRRVSNVVTNVTEPGIFGHGGVFMYDDGVREGLVMSRYD